MRLHHLLLFSLLLPKRIPPHPPQWVKLLQPDNCKDKDVSWSSNGNLADHSRPEPDFTSCSSANSLKSSPNFDTFESNAEHVEEFLKHLHYDGAESKYSLLVVLAKNISRSTERILDVCIADIKSHSKCLNDHCYKIAFPQLCSALRNFIWKKNLILFFRHLAYIFGQAPCLYHWIYWFKNGYN